MAITFGRAETVLFESTKRTPRPATGQHAELLEEITQAIAALTKVVELEKSGVCDGTGFWINRDPVLNAAKKLVALAEYRTPYSAPPHSVR